MASAATFFQRCLFSTVTNTARRCFLLTTADPGTFASATSISARFYSGEWKGKGKEKGALKYENQGKAWSDISPDLDPICPMPRERREHVKKGIIHRIKLKILEGGSNFGSK